MRALKLFSPKAQTMATDPNNDDHEELSEESLKELVSKFPKANPRPHHYVLAHVALRTLALDDPLQFLAVMGSPDAAKFVASIYDSVVESLKEEGPPDFAVDDVQFQCGKLGDWLCVVFTMPPPRDVTEAFFCCLAGHLDLNDPNPRPESVKGRWFAMEYTYPIGDQTRAVLCEWTKDGGHSNFGEAGEPTVENFLQRVADTVIGSK